MSASNKPPVTVPGYVTLSSSAKGTNSIWAVGVGTGVSARAASTDKTSSSASLRPEKSIGSEGDVVGVGLLYSFSASCT